MVAGGSGTERNGRIVRGVMCWLLLAASGVAAQGGAVPRGAADSLRVVVMGVGRVAGATAIVPGDRLPTGDLYASLRVTTVQNGPFALQARLAEPFLPDARRGAAAEVDAQTPSGTFQPLSVADWRTVAVGTKGGASDNLVQLLIRWAKASAKDPKSLADLRLLFRVVQQQ